MTDGKRKMLSCGDCGESAKGFDTGRRQPSGASNRTSRGKDWAAEGQAGQLPSTLPQAVDGDSHCGFPVLDSCNARLVSVLV